MSLDPKAVDAQAADAFKTRDATSYDPVAREYDVFIERYSGALAARCLALAAVGPSARVLDVGTGTGIVAAQAATLVGAAGRVLGVDLSDGMLAQAREKAIARGLGDRVEFRRMDAEQLDVPDASFDVVVSMFALHHFPSPDRALAEMRRVLRPGGVLCIGVGSGPSRFTLVGIADAIVQVRDLIKRHAGRLLRAPHFINELVERRFPLPQADELTDMAAHGWRDPRSVPAMVRAAGFERVATDWLGQRRVIDSAQEFWDLQRVYSSTARKRLATVTPVQLAAFEAEFLAACRAVQGRGGELVYSYAALYITARRPSESTVTS